MARFADEEPDVFELQSDSYWKWRERMWARDLCSFCGRHGHKATECESTGAIILRPQ